MKTYSDKQQENKSRAVANSVSQKKSKSLPALQSANEVTQNKLPEMADNSLKSKQAPQLMTDVVQREIPAPPTTISWADVRGVAADVGDLGIHPGRAGDSFLADAGLTYPHLHVWADGTIALSIRHGVNTKVGKDEEINIDALIDANRRFKPGGKVGELVARICASAS
jgi:hypothetical protein